MSAQLRASAIARVREEEEEVEERMGEKREIDEGSCLGPPPRPPQALQLVAGAGFYPTLPDWSLFTSKN